LFAKGRWDEASEALDHALELDPPPGYRARLLALRGDLELACGRVTHAIAVSEEVARLRGSRARWADLDTEVAAVTLHTRLELAAGHDESALRSALQCAAAWPASYAPRTAWPLVVSAALACRRAGVDLSGGVGVASAASARDAVADIASRMPISGPESYAWMCSLSAEIATPETRLTAREKELTAWEKADQPWQIGWALVRSAYGLLAASRRLEAADLLRRAVDIADSLGAVPLREAAAQAASRARLSIEPEEPQAVPDTSGHGLTPRELEVLGLLCQGRTNRQIGEELFISAKTASIHVSRILMKLGAANRGEAAAEAHRLGFAGQLTP
jgi:DNA-binding CsgD family transcriptional regulator